MSYDEILERCAWVVIQTIVRGEGLRGAMHVVDTMLINWRKENNVPPYGEGPQS